MTASSTHTSSGWQGLLASKTFHSVLGISISVLLLLWVFSEVNFSSLADQLLAARYWVLVPSFVLIALHFVFRALRWRYLMPNGEQTSFRARFDGILVGCFANFVLPLRAGEFVRPYMLSKISPISFVEGFASIVTERFFDLAACIITFALIIPYFPNVPDWVLTSAWMLGGVAICLFGFILAVSLFPQQLLSLFDRLVPNQEGPYTQKFRHFLQDFIDSARILARPQRLAMVIGLTVLVWGSNYLLYYCFLFLIDVPHDFLLGTSVAVIIALAVAAPSAPGFIGVYQTACVAAFALYQIPEEEALVYSIITHLVQYVVFIGYGIFALSRAGLHLKELREQSEHEVFDEDD